MAGSSWPTRSIFSAVRSAAARSKPCVAANASRLAPEDIVEGLKVSHVGKQRSFDADADGGSRREKHAIFRRSCRAIPSETSRQLRKRRFGDEIEFHDGWRCELCALPRGCASSHAGTAMRRCRKSLLLRRHANRAVEADDLAVQHLVLEDVAY